MWFSRKDACVIEHIFVLHSILYSRIRGYVDFSVHMQVYVRVLLNDSEGFTLLVATKTVGQINNKSFHGITNQLISYVAP